MVGMLITQVDIYFLGLVALLILIKVARLAMLVLVEVLQQEEVSVYI